MIGSRQGEVQRRFRWGRGSADRKLAATGGSGLGLPTVKRLVEAHQGEVSIEPAGSFRRRRTLM